ncbi:DNA methylase N-4/N-6 domain-containing protein [Dehalococcoides mccartyi]|uniref:DNA methylase N-4/N-6 domain-containing protein n=1 Tax=Dehalococcoides mccartyi TaxID=61435 RepID=UPI0002B76FB0|nr:DNA methylase N-4/N-6 domain-containing protein [Dehalococcoides mccartyi]AGG05952.1 DNA methylase N-4/N-6 domain-containing protein [Dehalococcoides mccartyi DCMB5]
MAKRYDTQTGNLFNNEVPKMPDGYYSVDKPNPNLRAFVEQHMKECPYDPQNDDYDVPAFDKPIETTKATVIYNMHTYWSKKPHDAIRQYIRHYTKLGDLVLDPFCGSGGTAVAALIEGRKSVVIDLDPSATHITAGSVAIVNPTVVHNAIEQILSETDEIAKNLYEIQCPRCLGRARVLSVTWSERFLCDKCLNVVAIWGLPGTGKNRGKSELKECPHCGNGIYVGDKRYGYVPVQFHLECISGCRPKRICIEQDDSSFNELVRLNEHVQKLKFSFWYPTAEFPDGLETIKRKHFKQIGFTTIDTIFTSRNLHALAGLWDAINRSQEKDILRFVFTSFVLNASKLYRFREDGGGQPTGNYYVPPINRELNVFDAFVRKASDIEQAKNAYFNSVKSGKVIISTESALDLSTIPSNSVDYIFTDPPYGNTYQYRELNAVWNGWLINNANPHPEDMVVNEYQGKDESEWGKMFLRSFRECARVLKPGRFLSLCFHHTSSEMWTIVQDMMSECGFLVEEIKSATSIGTGQRSYYQRVLNNTVQRDLVINFRKPKPGELTAAITITGNEDKTTFSEKVRRIISDYLGANPGSTKDRIYDEVVSRMVRSGQMEAHDFDEVLQTVAEEVKTPVMKNLFDRKDADLFGSHEICRWYLKEAELVVPDAAETAREDLAAEKLGTFIKGYLMKHAGDEGVHYSDLFQHFIYAVKDKPRRHLAEFLPDYFYKTEQGTWKLAASEEEELAKREARVKGLGRRVKRYIAQLEQGVIIPDHERPSDATLAEWIRHCKRAGLYEQGKYLYEKGGLNLGNLTEEVMASVEEDYQVSARMLARASG